MSRPDPPSRAFVVTRQGDTSRTVIALDAWAALGVVLREDGLLEGTRDVVVRLTDRGVVARSEGATYTVRAHLASTALTTAELDAATDLRAACERALDAVLRVAPAESAAVLRVEGRYLRFVAARGPHATSILGLRLPSSSGLAGYVLQTQRPLVVGDAARHPRHDGAIDAITGYRTRQVLAVPVSGGGTVHGVLELMNPPDDRVFGPEERRGVEAVATVLGDWIARAGA